MSTSVTKDNGTIVSTLICHRDMACGLTCLTSLLRYSQDKIGLLMIHDDGSLTDDDVAILHEKLAPARVIRRAEADEQMEDQLRPFPMTAAFRRRYFSGLKLCDTFYFSSGDIYGYCDSDLLFFRPFQGLFALPDAGTNALMMDNGRDNFYSVRSWQFMGSPLRLPMRCNSGLVCIRRSHYDPKFIEWFLGEKRYAGNTHYGVQEQTAWAALAMMVGCRKWDPRQFAVAQPDLTITDRTIGVHCVGMFRELLLPGYIRLCVPPDAGVAPAQVATVPAKPCGALRLARDESRRVLLRKWKRMFG